MKNVFYHLAALMLLSSSVLAQRPVDISGKWLVDKEQVYTIFWDGANFTVYDAQDVEFGNFTPEGGSRFLLRYTVPKKNGKIKLKFEKVIFKKERLRGSCFRMQRMKKLATVAHTGKGKSQPAGDFMPIVITNVKQ